MSSLKAMVKQIEEESHGFAPSHVHELLELCMAITGRGEIGDDYTKTIGFPMNNYTIYSDPYYNQISIISFAGEEMEIESETMMHKLAEEFEKRILSFDRKRKGTREENTERVFDTPIDFINFED